MRGRERPSTNVSRLEKGLSRWIALAFVLGRQAVLPMLPCLTTRFGCAPAFPRHERWRKDILMPLAAMSRCHTRDPHLSSQSAAGSPPNRSVGFRLSRNQPPHSGGTRMACCLLAINGCIDPKGGMLDPSHGLLRSRLGLEPVLTEPDLDRIIIEEELEAAQHVMAQREQTAHRESKPARGAHGMSPYPFVHTLSAASLQAHVEVVTQRTEGPQANASKAAGGKGQLG